MQKIEVCEKDIEEENIALLGIGDILPTAMALVVTGVGVAVGLQIMGDVQDDMTVDSEEYNATGDAISGVSKFPAKFGLIATVVVAAIILGVLVNFLVMRFSN